MIHLSRRAVTLGLLAAPAIARAQAAWPERPVRLVVPYSAGGVADTIARTLQAHCALVEEHVELAS